MALWHEGHNPTMSDNEVQQKTTVKDGANLTYNLSKDTVP